MADLADRTAARRAPGAGSEPGQLPRVPILMYHEIATGPASARHLAVSPDDFAEQLGYLHGSGYTTLTVTDLVQLMSGRIGPWPARPIVLTFDDGFADFHRAALPLLRSCDFTATVFVTTGWVADAAAQADRPAPYRMLCWSQIEESAAAGIEIGAHTHSHPQLDQLAGDVLRRELDGGKALLEDRLGLAVTGLAYPFGYFSSRVRVAAATAGYRYACAVGNRFTGGCPDLFALPRLTIGRRPAIRGFSQVVRGERLPPEFLAYRTMTRGWSAVRAARSTLNRASQ